MKIKNENPKRFFAKHMTQGVAGYQDFNLYAGNEAILNMEKSFEGKPLVVDHQDIDHDNIKNQMDGVVVKSFYNKADGWHWAEIVAITDLAVDAIENKKWAVSNCYTPTILNDKGTYLNIAYDQVLSNGCYDHLALVENPRYEDSVVLTPAEFKAYNDEKEAQLFSNSKFKKSKGKARMFEFFKKVKVENDLNAEELIVKLENGREISIAEAVEKLSNMLDETVIIEGSVYSFGSLVEEKKEQIINAKKYSEKEKEELENEEDDEKEVENESKEKDKKAAKDVENEEDEDDDKENEKDKENEDDEVDLENSKQLEQLMNEGHFSGTMELIRSKGDSKKVMSDYDRMEIGKQRY